MPTNLLETYFPVLLQILIAALVAGGLIFASVALGKRLRNKVKDTPYECGITPVGSARERFSVKFYLVAMLFILFDIEAIFLFPWAVTLRELGMYGFVVMFIFFGLGMDGLYYMWKKGVLNWAADEPPAPAERPASLAEGQKYAA